MITELKNLIGLYQKINNECHQLKGLIEIYQTRITFEKDKKTIKEYKSHIKLIKEIISESSKMLEKIKGIEKE